MAEPHTCTQCRGCAEERAQYLAHTSKRPPEVAKFRDCRHCGTRLLTRYYAYRKHERECAEEVA